MLCYRSSIQTPCTAAAAALRRGHVTASLHQRRALRAIASIYLHRYLSCGPSRGKDPLPHAVPSRASPPCLGASQPSCGDGRARAALDEEERERLTEVRLQEHAQLTRGCS